MTDFEIISTKELINLIDDNSVHIIDVRSSDNYNGWKIKNEKRGGHIKNARSLPIKWIKYLDWLDIVKAKKILPENKIIIYSNNNEESEKVANMFKEFGYNQLLIYQKFMEEWIPNESLPLNKLSKYHHLISAQ